MAVCEYCGAAFLAKRKDAKYCCPKHRVYAARQRQRAERDARKQMMTLEGRALLDKLSAILPATAAGVERFIEVNGVDCTEAAIKLCLTAYSEAASVGQAR